METETLKVTWKIIRRAGQGRTPESYCSYIAENDNRAHRLKTHEGTKLFDILKKTKVSDSIDRYNFSVLIDGVYHNNKLVFVTNFRVVKNENKR